MKTILAFIGGSDRDPVILRTAMAAAQPLAAHLELVHVQVPAIEAARYARTEFASGTALRNALQSLATNARTFSELAERNVREFCASAAIDLCDTPRDVHALSVSFREEKSNAIERLTVLARHRDLTVIGRARQKQGLAPDTLMHLLLECGRPLLVAASAAPQRLTDTIVVCWNETSAAARVVTAALPLLSRAKRIVLVRASEGDAEAAAALDDLARQFAWSGIAAETRLVAASGRAVARALTSAVEECNADLVVMGAYGRSRARELIWGSCTEAVLEACDRPILLLH